LSLAADPVLSILRKPLVHESWARLDERTESRKIATVMLKDRHSARLKSLLKATIRFYNRNVTLDCLVRDISPTGAKLELESPSVLPREFELAVPQRSAIYPCELKWRREKAAGVRFKENIDPAAAHYGEFAKARIETLEKENAALRLEVSRLTLLLQQSSEASSGKGPAGKPS
jgi:hypothetical protein